MKIVFMGTPDFGIHMLEELNKVYDVCMVVTQPDKPQGRKGELVATPIKVKALELGLNVYQPTDIKTQYQPILDLKPDIVITAAYGQFVPDILLNTPPYKAINVHASLLPKLRGGAPVHKAIIRGHKKTGVTIMYMDRKMDVGDIISKVETPILDSDNLDILYHRLADLGTKLLVETLPKIFSNDINPVKQDESLATYASNVSKKLEHIDFNKSVRSVFNLIRGLSPKPGAYGILNGVKVKFYESKIINETPSENGKVICIDKKLIIGFLDGQLEILDLQVEGKKRILAKDFLNGQKLFNIGDTLE